MNPDTYYGPRAKNYDADRCHSLRWANEQRAVAEMVFSGPVLDCPLGTGRYVEIYREKNLPVIGVDVSTDMIVQAHKRYPDMDARKGSIFALPFENDVFESAVCIRFLDWCYPDQMAKAIAELRRVARTIIVSIRHGDEGKGPINYTHSLSNFFEQVQGLIICNRRTTETTKDGTEEIFRLRPPEWQDFIRQFYWHGHTPEFEAYRLAAELALRLGFKPPKISEDTCRLRAEYWTADEVGAALDKIAMPGHDSRPPKFQNYPLTILETQGKQILLDGRRRADKWRKMPGRYPVLVVEA